MTIPEFVYPGIFVNQNTSGLFYFGVAFGSCEGFMPGFNYWMS